MEILEVKSTEYNDIIQKPYHVFNSGAFALLNSKKCEEVIFLLFRENKYRIGMIGGVKDNCFLSPFSAPFGGLSYLSEDIKLQYIEESIRLLKTWGIKKKFDAINITLPPIIYNSSFISKQINCLWRENFNISEIDLNYSFDLDLFNDNYQEIIWYNARKNLKIAFDGHFSFIECITGAEKEMAYDIILKNRESRGFPLRMTWSQVNETTQLIKADFFILYNQDKVPVASAIVFHVTQTIVQVVYWGDLPGYSANRPMNFLSFKVFEYYKTAGKKIVDIGPSTENSVPNYGLAEFKESLACTIDPKLKFSINLT